MAEHVHLLGSARLVQSSTSVQFLADKRYQLLAYLAYQKDWVSREQLLYLFWSDGSGEHARNNLRQLLKRVRELDCASGIEANGQHLRWSVDSDAGSFKQAVSEADWVAALAHYGGLFLESFIGYESAEYLNWLEPERERLHDQWCQAVQRRAEHLTREGNHLGAVELLRPLIEGNDLDENALKAFMQAAVNAGGRELALKAYQDFANRLQAELNLTPTTELEQLAHSVRTVEGAGEAKLLRVPKTSQPKLAAPQSSFLSMFQSTFIGRDLELAEVTELLTDPNCRLLTLTGAGGVGKTRIALQVAEQLTRNYQDGVVLVSLETLSAANLIPLTIADGLKLVLEGTDDALNQITRAIAEKNLLLVLDNFEHLLEGATVVSELLQRCPRLTLLVTSHESLDVAEEWRFPVGGLSYPADTISLEESKYFDAVKLFVGRVKQVQPDFALGQAELPHVLQICQRLEGSALGLELAAVWAKTLSLADIAGEIGTNLDFLTSTSRGRAERHSSIRAVFNYSWRLLTLTEQGVLKKLSVLAGGFSREAAKQVAGATLPVLAALVDKSLLRFSATGRYDGHALVRQYSLEKLGQQPDEKARTEEKHAMYYLQLVQQGAASLHSRQHQTARGLIIEEFANIRRAWQWAVKQVRLDVLERTTFALSDLLEGHRYEGQALFQGAAAALDETNPRHHAALGYVRVAQTEQGGHQHFGYDLSKQILQRAFVLLEPLGEERAISRGLRMVAECEHCVGNFAEAERVLHKALILGRDYGSPREVGSLLLV